VSDPAEQNSRSLSEKHSRKAGEMV
jgi:hypothetical protein